MEQIIRVGMDRSKSVFQLHGVNASEQPILRKKLSRKEMIRFFEKMPPTIVGLEHAVAPTTGQDYLARWATR